MFLNADGSLTETCLLTARFLVKQQRNRRYQISPQSVAAPLWPDQFEYTV